MHFAARKHLTPMITAQAATAAAAAVITIRKSVVTHWPLSLQQAASRMTSTLTTMTTTTTGKHFVMTSQCAINKHTARSARNSAWKQPARQCDMSWDLGQTASVVELQRSVESQQALRHSNLILSCALTKKPTDIIAITRDVTTSGVARVKRDMYVLSIGPCFAKNVLN